MKLLWQEEPLTSNQIISYLSDSVDWSPKTIKTLLNRLVKKKALGYEKVGRLYNYYPLVNENDCARAEGFSFLNRVYNGAIQPMFTAFLEDAKLSREEIENLKQILDKKEKKKS